jgi:hypothetical protein
MTRYSINNPRMLRDFKIRLPLNPPLTHIIISFVILSGYTTTILKEAARVTLVLLSTECRSELNKKSSSNHLEPQRSYIIL